MHWWKPPQPVGDAPIRLLVCVALWSLPDLELLDFIESSLGNLADNGEEMIRVDIVTFDGFKASPESRLYYPGFDVCATPVVGLWRHGSFERAEVGGELARLVLRQLRGHQ
jgi:hypothetical protein